MIRTDEYIKKIITENLYLHFFNREIYRGIYGERIEKMEINHSDILATLMLCGCNTFVTSFSAYRETINMLIGKGKVYRELNDYGIIKVSGETLNTDMILGHKQEIYYHDRDKYPGYFCSKEMRMLENIVPTIIKPDVTDRLEELFLDKKWDNIFKYAPTIYDRNVIKNSKEQIVEIIRNRENKAITKAIFRVDDRDKRLPVSVGRTLTGIYVDDYRKFTEGDIATGVEALKEYDYLALHFPFHDYEILRELLTQLGFPRVFTIKEFEILLKYYYTAEHSKFALKVQSLLYMLYRLHNNKRITIPLETMRLRFLALIKENLFNLDVKGIDFQSNNFFHQGIENVDTAILKVTYKKDKVKKRSRTMENKKVFVVTGRDDKLRLSIFNLLRALKLEPMEWMDVIRTTGDPSAYLHDAIKKSIGEAGAVVVIMVPEEKAQLSEKYRSEPEDDKENFQPRPNVIFEAGLALGLKEEKTIILQFGDIRIFSDIIGKHILKYYGKSREVEFKNDLRQKLEIAGCKCEAGNDFFSINIDYK